MNVPRAHGSLNLITERRGASILQLGRTLDWSCLIVGMSSSRHLDPARDPHAFCLLAATTREVNWFNYPTDDTSTVTAGQTNCSRCVQSFCCDYR
jgi:hypothetical protein